MTEKENLINFFFSFSNILPFGASKGVQKLSVLSIVLSAFSYFSYFQEVAESTWTMDNLCTPTKLSYSAKQL